MEVTDEEESSPIASEGGVGGGKYLLYGWLVGRAAADLGLAQALAFSEAQRGEQIKRLEESLLGRIRELQNPDLSGDVKASAEVDALKVELQRVCDSQRQLAADRVHVEQLEILIRGKLREFEDYSQQQLQDGAGSELGDIKLELKLLVDRIARAEYALQQVQAHAECENQRVDEMTAYRPKTQLAAEVANDNSTAAVAQSVETNLQEQLAEIRAELGQGTRAAAARGSHE